MILLGLGSNLGNRQANLEAALALLGEGEAAPLRLLRISPVYESAALLPEGAPAEWDIAYYNIVALAESSLAPLELLAAVKAVERKLGREDIGRWGPRVVDIDILAHGETQLAEERLTLPHTAMLERDFVMLPLMDVQPHWRHPQTGESAMEVVRRKGMTIGTGLMRTRITLRWPVAGRAVI